MAGAGKQIYLLRHGQSMYNAKVSEFMETIKTHESEVEYWEREDAYDPLIFDSPLSPKGEEQARKVNIVLKHMRIELVVVSPLTRALQTASIACKGLHIPFLVTPLLREQLFSSCDVGRSGLALSKDFPALATQLATLQGNWWGAESEDHFSMRNGVPMVAREALPNMRQRLEALVALVAARPEHRILVVGHAVLFYHLVGKWLANCEVCEWDFEKGLVHCSCRGLLCRCGSPERDADERESAIQRALEGAAEQAMSAEKT